MALQHKHCPSFKHHEKAARRRDGEAVLAVVGVGSVFPVDIELSETVGDLKEKIKEENPGLIVFPASKLKLYLAREGDAWLSSRDQDIKALKKQEVPDRVKSLMQEDLLLDETAMLDDEEYFGAHFKPRSRTIHVLVELPEDASLIRGSHNKRGAEELGEIVEARIIKVLAERDEKNSAHLFSDLDSEMKERLVKKMRLAKNVPTDIDEPPDTSIPGYSWIPQVSEGEESQRTGYMAYLRQHLAPLMNREHFVLADIADDNSVLTIVDPRLPFRMNGTADVLLIKGTRMNPLIKLAGVCAVIELKKKVKRCHVPQAVGRLVSSSIKAPLNCNPLSLLTDLNDIWFFSWFSGEQVVTHLTLEYPKNAFMFLEAFVSEGPRSTPFRLPFLPQPVKNLKVDDFLPMPVDTRAEEMMERYELMADVVEPEFLMARRMEYGQHLVQAMPMYAHMFE